MNRQLSPLHIQAACGRSVGALAATAMSLAWASYRHGGFGHRSIGLSLSICKPQSKFEAKDPWSPGEASA